VLYSRLKLFVIPALAMLLLGVASAPLHAADWSNLSKKKVTKLGLYMGPNDAAKYVAAHGDKTLFVDIRTAAELTYLGTPAITDAHVPYEFMDRTKWNDKKSIYLHTVNPNFVADITARVHKKGLSKNDTVILMCRSGNRSAKGANLLAAAGYSKVYNLVEGYEGDKSKTSPNKGKRAVNGWKNSGQPWTYSLDKDIMYLPK